MCEGTRHSQECSKWLLGVLSMQRLSHMLQSTMQGVEGQLATQRKGGEVIRWTSVRSIERGLWVHALQ